MKPSDFIRVLENADAPALTGHDAGGEALLVLLAHVYYADDKIDAGELNQLARLSGTEGDGLKTRLHELKAKDLDIAKLGELYPDAGDRDDIVTLVEHAVWGDNDVDGREWDIVDKLVEGLGVVRK